MVGTRGSSGDTKKRTSRRGQPEEEPITSLNVPPPSAFGYNDHLTPGSGTNPVALTVSGPWNPPPSIGEIEAMLMAEGRAQHRICRIEVRQDCAIVEVHPEDVRNCIGLIQYGDLEVREACMRPRWRAEPHSRALPAAPAAPPPPPPTPRATHIHQPCALEQESCSQPLPH